MTTSPTSPTPPTYANAAKLASIFANDAGYVESMALCRDVVRQLEFPKYRDVMVGWWHGTAWIVVAVRSYLDVKLEDDEVADIAYEAIQEYLRNPPAIHPKPDFILR